ncbi:MAG: PAS domain-containing protein [Pirellulaceae bacterium]|nr:PAS domain-containing protein [Planctomycetales bacterium]
MNWGEQKAMRDFTKLTGVERSFDEDEIIVSKTDTKGRITYANEVFLRVAQYTEEEVLGQPHNLIRHPEMPRCVFQYLWDTISEGREVFAYVINRTKLGDHYWVFAHVTPTFDTQGRIIGYHSNRRVPDRKAVETVRKLYTDLRSVESKAGSARAASEAGLAALVGRLQEMGTTYDELIFQLAREGSRSSMAGAC